MKQLHLVIAVLVLLVSFLYTPPPAEAGVVDGAKKVGRFIRRGTKKVLQLPLYVALGIGSSLVVWWHLGGHEQGDY